MGRGWRDERDGSGALHLIPARAQAHPRWGPLLGPVRGGKPRLLGASFGSLAVSNTAISMLELSLALRLRGAGIVFPAIGHGAVQIAPAARQRGEENNGRDA